MGERKGKGESMALTNFEELFKDFPEMRLLRSWVDEFYGTIAGWEKEGGDIDSRYYKKAGNVYDNLFGYIWAMNDLGKIDIERTRLLCEELLQAFKFNRDVT